MSAATDWLELARESWESARRAEQDRHYRTAVSRYYYAAYQSATAALVALKQVPPTRREAWSHEATPTLLEEATRSQIPSAESRRELRDHLRDLYAARLLADYVASAGVGASAAIQSRQYAEVVLSTTRRIVGGEGGR